MKHDQAKTLVEWINDSDYEPNDWEGNFIESILDSERDLSKKQDKCLQAIYEKSSGDGMYQNRDRV